MNSRYVTLLGGDSRTREMKHWPHWIRQVPTIRRKFCRYADDFDPLHFNEAASVAVLANAASRAGFLALTEYVVQKRQLTRGRPFRHGRCDLWIAETALDFSWAFEFKQHFAATNIRQATFDERLERATQDARRVDRAEADRRFGCLLVAPRVGARFDQAVVERIDRFCGSSDIAFRIGGGRGPTWLAFSSVD